MGPALDVWRAVDLGSESLAFLVLFSFVIEK